MLIEAKVVAFFFLVSVFIFHFLLHVTTNRSNTPASNTPTPLECTLTPLKKEEKKGLRDQWTGMSVYALIHAVHASVGKVTRKVSPAVVHLLGHTHTLRESGGATRSLKDSSSLLHTLSRPTSLRQ